MLFYNNFQGKIKHIINKESSIKGNKDLKDFMTRQYLWQQFNQWRHERDSDMR